MYLGYELTPAQEQILKEALNAQKKARDAQPQAKKEGLKKLEIQRAEIPTTDACAFWRKRLANHTNWSYWAKFEGELEKRKKAVKSQYERRLACQR